MFCAERVLEYCGQMTFEQFVADSLTYDATLRNLEIMGEAAKRVRVDARARFSDVP